jgi:phage tail-like protein
MRSANTDYYHNFRFHVGVAGWDGVDYLSTTQAGFNTCTTPEYTLEATEYREGIYSYTRKFPGIVTVSDITLGRGVVRTASRFYEWMVRAVEGGEYRADVTIYHYHRVGKEPDESAGVSGGSPRDDLRYAKRYNCKECLPIRFKPAGDLDATASDVSIQEVDIAMERFEIEEPPEAYPDGWVPTGYLSNVTTIP